MLPSCIEGIISSGSVLALPFARDNLLRGVSGGSAPLCDGLVPSGLALVVAGGGV